MRAIAGSFKRCLPTVAIASSERALGREIVPGYDGSYRKSYPRFIAYLSQRRMFSAAPYYAQIGVNESQR